MFRCSLLEDGHYPKLHYKHCKHYKRRTCALLEMSQPLFQSLELDPSVGESALNPECLLSVTSFEPARIRSKQLESSGEISDRNHTNEKKIRKLDPNDKHFLHFSNKEMKGKVFQELIRKGIDSDLNISDQTISKYGEQVFVHGDVLNLWTWIMCCSWIAMIWLNYT